MTDATYLPASAFKSVGLEFDQLRAAADRDLIAVQRARSEANPTGRNRYRLADVMARWPEHFPKSPTNPHRLELSGDSGQSPLTDPTSWGKIDSMMIAATPFTTLTKAARALGVPGPFLRRQVEAGRVPALRVGRGLRIDPKAARAALSRLAAETTGAQTPEEQ